MSESQQEGKQIVVLWRVWKFDSDKMPKLKFPKFNKVSPNENSVGSDGALVQRFYEELERVKEESSTKDNNHKDLSRSDSLFEQEALIPGYPEYKPSKESYPQIIHAIARSGDVALYKKCKCFTNVDCFDETGRTPLMSAILNNQREIIRQLCRDGAQINIPDDEGRTALHYCVYLGNYNAVRDIVHSRKSVPIPLLGDNQGRTILHWSASSDNTQLLKFLLDEIVQDRGDIDVMDDQQMTPLHWAVYHNQPKNVKLLLNEGANVHSTCIEGKTILHWCAPIKDTDCARVIIKYFRKQGGNYHEFFNQRDLELRHVLHLACGENNKALVDLLSVQVPRLDFNAKDIHLRTPLHWSAVSGHSDLIILLLQRGADDMATDSTGATPLHYACSRNQTRCVESLLQGSMKTATVRDNEDRDPLVWAVTKGNLQCCRLLLERGVDPDAADSQGSTGKIDIIVFQQIILMCRIYCIMYL